MMGVQGNLTTPESGMLSLEEMALGLSRIPRFAGQTLLEWSVADHSICLARFVGHTVGPTGGRLALLLLLHDAHEALTGDIPTTFKTPDMKKLQGQLDVRLFNSLQVWGPNAEEEKTVRYYDEMALLSEAYVLTPRATYEALVESRDRLHNPSYCDIISEWLHEDRDSQTEWLSGVKLLLNHFGRRSVAGMVS